MIKKLIIVAVLIFSAQNTFAQTARTRREPAFFMPQQTLDKMHQAEKLPPVETMRLNGKTAPVVEEMQQKARTNAEKERAAQLAAEQKAKAETDKKRAEQIAALNQKKAEAEKKRAELLEKQQKQKAEQQRLASQAAKDKPKQPYPDNYKPKSGNAGVIKTPETPPKLVVTKSLAKMPSATNEDNKSITNAYNFSYDDIIAEYKRDAEKISKKIPFDNPRLKSVIQDYRNLERKI